MMDIDDEDDAFISSGAGLIDMAFNKKKSDERKKWLSNVRLSPRPSRLNCFRVVTNNGHYPFFTCPR